MMGEIWILAELLANIPLTKQETKLNPVQNKDMDGFLGGVSQEKLRTPKQGSH